MKKEYWEYTVKKGFCDCKYPSTNAGYVPPDYKKLLIICQKCNRRRKGSEI